MNQVSILICPGFHDAALTDRFVRSLPAFVEACTVTTFPADPFATLNRMTQTFQSQPVVGIGFSGGAVGLVGASQMWQQQGGAIAQLFIVDGWGVPTAGLPVYRLSHDAFTHWSSAALGAGRVNFYADPAVGHLELWANPGQVKGYRLSEGRDDRRSQGERMTAAEFIASQLNELTHRV